MAPMTTVILRFRFTFLPSLSCSLILRHHQMFSRFRNGLAHSVSQMASNAISHTMNLSTAMAQNHTL
jgi:hypothetical protein